MRKVSFILDAFEHYNFWAGENKKTYTRINELIKDIGRDPFSGICKP